ncbi:hypothetical protein POI8812_03563 [Pontivivens insulae]|uniref:Uncharacterized protein n=1 Tax=Pontivivens insulae TaxID=1639689 RepID=A0A2R8AG76_9RHOB|nr:hypothetical protein POI8812_03563 [Pontivivens insulae]
MFGPAWGIAFTHAGLNDMAHPGRFCSSQHGAALFQLAHQPHAGRIEVLDREDAGHAFESWRQSFGLGQIALDDFRSLIRKRLCLRR